MEYLKTNPNISQAARMFSITRAVVYDILKKEREGDLRDRSRAPRCQPTWSPELAQAVLSLREQYPRWGKDNLVILLRRQGFQVSTAWVVLKHFTARDTLCRWDVVEAHTRATAAAATGFRDTAQQMLDKSFRSCYNHTGVLLLRYGPYKVWTIKRKETLGAYVRGN